MPPPPPPPPPPLQVPDHGQFMVESLGNIGEIPKPEPTFVHIKERRTRKRKERSPTKLTYISQEQPSQPAPEQSADASLSSADEGSESNVKASEEALRGPSHPPPREEYDFEKEIDGKPAADQRNAQSTWILTPGTNLLCYLTSFSLF